MRELHLFAGCGGGILGGMLLGHTCVGAVEIDPYCQEQLRARQQDGQLEQFPVFGDIRDFDGTAWRGRVDVVCGGFPCQPWSSAGKRLGTADSRHLWPEMARVIGECRPAFVFAENVSMEAFREPWRDLRAMGYHVPPALRLAAEDLGAPYRRKRWWMLAADADSEGQFALPVDAEVERTPKTQTRHADRPGLAERKGQCGHARQEQPTALGAAWRSLGPRLLRLVSRVPSRVDAEARIRAAGNAQVPQVAAAAFMILTGTLRGRVRHDDFCNCECCR